MFLAFRALVLASIGWFLVSSLWNFPHSLSYFNELIGGPENGPQHLLGSNVDWGQDLRYLKWWAEANRTRAGNRSLRLAYRGSFNPSDVGFADALPWTESDGDNLAYLIADTDGAIKLAQSEGWFTEPDEFAISVSLFFGDPALGKDGSNSLSGPVPQELLEQLRPLAPTASIGGSILLFAVTASRTTE